MYLIRKHIYRLESCAPELFCAAINVCQRSKDVSTQNSVPSNQITPSTPGHYNLHNTPGAESPRVLLLISLAPRQQRRRFTGRHVHIHRSFPLGEFFPKSIICNVANQAGISGGGRAYQGTPPHTTRALPSGILEPRC